MPSLFSGCRDGTPPLAVGPVNPGLFPGQADQTGSAGGCHENLGPADRSFRRTARAAPADAEVRPGPRPPTLTPHQVKAREAGPEALPTSSLPNLAYVSGAWLSLTMTHRMTNLCRWLWWRLLMTATVMRHVWRRWPFAGRSWLTRTGTFSRLRLSLLPPEARRYRSGHSADRATASTSSSMSGQRGFSPISAKLAASR